VWRATHKVRRGFATHPNDAKVAEWQQYLQTPNSPSLPAAGTKRCPRNTQMVHATHKWQGKINSRFHPLMETERPISKWPGYLDQSPNQQMAYPED
jgi:hypothetical protein